MSTCSRSGISELIDNSFAALAVIGLVTLATVGMLLYYMKPQLTMLRPVLAGDGKDEPAEEDAGGEPVAAGAGRAPALARPPWDSAPIPAVAAARARPTGRAAKLAGRRHRASDDSPLAHLP